MLFLSTLSLRRATPVLLFFFILQRYFYPRSPCGERHSSAPGAGAAAPISIHALLAESDGLGVGLYLVTEISIHALLAESDYDGLIASANFCKFLSTLSLRRATVTVLGIQHRVVISIHALLAESDSCFIVFLHFATLFLSTLSLRRATFFRSGGWGRSPNFYPRSPCGERRFRSRLVPRNRNFYPRSPCGERPSWFARLA